MDNKEKVRKMVSDCNIGMFVTEADGKLVSRPIAVTEMDNNNDVWFFTDLTSEKTTDIYNNRQVNFSFANKEKNEYVSLSGTASVVSDQNLINEKWSYFMKVWYPEGKETEKLTLIRVRPDTVQFWDGSSSKLVNLYDMAKALATGRSHEEVSSAEKEKVNY